MAKKKRRSQIPHPMDVALGRRIREIRESKDISMQMLGVECGVRIGQVAKYERGTNRVSFSRLTEIAKALDITVLDLVAPVCGQSSAHRSPAE